MSECSTRLGGHPEQLPERTVEEMTASLLKRHEENKAGVKPSGTPIVNANVIAKMEKWYRNDDSPAQPAAAAAAASSSAPLKSTGSSAVMIAVCLILILACLMQPTMVDAIHHHSTNALEQHMESTHQQQAQIGGETDWFRVMRCCIARPRPLPSDSVAAPITCPTDASFCGSIPKVILDGLQRAASLPVDEKWRPSLEKRASASKQPVRQPSIEELTAKLLQRAKQGSTQTRPVSTGKNSKVLQQWSRWSSPGPITPAVTSKPQVASSNAKVTAPTSVPTKLGPTAPIRSNRPVAAPMPTSRSAAAAALLETDISSTTPGSPNLVWPGGVVHYRWHPFFDVIRQQHPQVFADLLAPVIESYELGIADWSAEGCVQFVHSPLPQPAASSASSVAAPAPVAPARIVVFQVDPDAEYAHTNGIGTQVTYVTLLVPRANQQVLDLSGPHELGHVLGLDHTMNRRDRDQYVEITTDSGMCAFQHCGPHSTAAQAYRARCQDAGIVDAVRARVNAENLVLPDPFVKFLRYVTENQNEQGRPYNTVPQVIAPNANPEEFEPDDVDMCALFHCAREADIFAQYTRVDNAKIYVPYDFASVMHYAFGSCMAPKNGMDQFVEDGLHMPRSTGQVSSYDKQTIRQLYQCGTRVTATGSALMATGTSARSNGGYTPSTRSWSVTRFINPTTKWLLARSQLSNVLTYDWNREYTDFNSDSLKAAAQLPIRPAAGAPEIDRRTNVGAAPVNIVFQ